MEQNVLQAGASWANEFGYIKRKQTKPKMGTPRGGNGVVCPFSMLPQIPRCMHKNQSSLFSGWCNARKGPPHLLQDHHYSTVRTPAL